MDTVTPYTSFFHNKASSFTGTHSLSGNVLPLHCGVSSMRRQMLQGQLESF
uniref:Uncharacterized protein n=1 Tax=Anguilla anguilla TaxID=7936 RepID=A0A0E9VKB3_ANGAN